MQNLTHKRARIQTAFESPSAESSQVCSDAKSSDSVNVSREKK